MFALIAQSSSTSPSGSAFTPILFLGLMVGVFYVVAIRPQRRKTQAQRQLTEAVEVGDEVIMAGGLFGTVKEMDDDVVTLEISPGTNVRMLKRMIVQRLVDEYEDEPNEENDQSS